MSVLLLGKGGSHPHCTALLRLCRETVLSCSALEGRQKSRVHSEKGDLHGEVSASHNIYFNNLSRCSLETLSMSRV